MRTRYLLDTHVLIWALLDPSQIPDDTLARFRDARTEVLVSAASAWEIGTKVRLGKLGHAESIVHGYADYLARLSVRELPVTSHHALTAGMLRWDHRDPFDRVIVAQCMIESITLVTADKTIAAFPAVTTLW